MPTRNVNLTEELDRFVLSKIKSGRYENTSEVVRAALRIFEREEQEHEAKLAALRAASTRETQAVLPAAAYFPVSEKLLDFQPRGVREWLRFTSLAAPKLTCLR